MGGALSSRTVRGISPVVGVVLLFAVVLVLAALTSAILVGTTKERSPAPTVSLDVEHATGSGTYELVHEQGATLDGDSVAVRGVANADVLGGQEFTAGESVAIDPTGDTVRVVWFEANEDASYTIATLDVPADGSSGSGSGGGGGGGGASLVAFDATVFTANGSGLKAIGGDGEDVDLVSVSGSVEATGAATTDVTGDGAVDLPYVDGSGEVKVVDAEGDVTTLASNGDVSDGVQTSKTRLATGSWDGSPTSVFFVNGTNDALYRVAPGGSPTLVKDPSDGAQSVIGIGDVDGDGTDELVFGDSSQHVRYLEPDGTVVKVTNGGTGSNNGIGTGSLADLDGDGVPAILMVDGSNNLVINRQPSAGTDTTITLNAESDEAAKAPPTAADVDGDGALEVVYATSSDNDRVIKYVDDVGGANDLEVLKDDEGDDVNGSDETGTV